MKLDNFINMMTGLFDNKEQFDVMQEAGKSYPYAEHVNTVCNDKIKNIPADFNGKFIVEESYYETNGKRHASPHLFLITENEDGILLSSYEIPGDDKNTFSASALSGILALFCNNVISFLSILSIIILHSFLCTLITILTYDY